MTGKFSPPVLTQPGKETRIVFFSTKIHNNYVTSEPYILIGIDRFCKMPVVRICKTNEAREVNIVLESFIKLDRVPAREERLKEVVPSYPIILTSFAEKIFFFEITYSPPRLHAGVGAVEHAIQTLENMMIAVLGGETGFNGAINCILRVTRFTIHTALKLGSFDLHQGKKLRTEVTNIFKDTES